MGVFDRYKCDGQMNIFDFIEKNEKGEIWDSDVREIHSKLVEFADHYGCKIESVEFSVWSHVPQYGYRLFLNMRIPKVVLVEERFKTELDNIQKYALSRKVELSPLWGACIYRGGEDTVRLSFSTTFLDKARQRIR